MNAFDILREKVQERRKYYRNQYEEYLDGEYYRMEKEIVLILAMINEVEKEFKKTPTPDHPIPIDTQIYIQELESRVNNNGWISCNERLPEYGKAVLTCDKDGWISVNINAPYNGAKNDFECGYYVAWQPLPEPYKGE